MSGQFDNGDLYFTGGGYCVAAAALSLAATPSLCTT